MDQEHDLHCSRPRAPRPRSRPRAVRGPPFPAHAARGCPAAPSPCADRPGH
ncbi:hypothetical protein SLNWT_1008 [Streptomyces albus]|uniref:Uncharacterized protein n=1 Tax=Streptomyces albus (strain ATCC 21838 / DSM 41398 / FERM P-419 / JCM 4703 / NBRC 107858) TaxID=1081613 RepID=A0A0B5EIU1_STRA4|nr:hypothetical protein SLNWT_1008 [Streptomyces albus]AOU75700.1 hypothetical protein SLNHY_1009 [Streptomyces albus]